MRFEEEIETVADSGKGLTGKVGLVGFEGASGGDDGVVLVDELMEWDICTDRDTAMESDAECDDLLDLLLDEVAGESKFRNALVEHAAGFGVFFVDGDGVPEQSEFAGSGESGHAGADDSDALLRGGEVRLEDDGVGWRFVSGAAFGGTYSHRFAEAFVAVAAGGFAGAGADTAKDAGKDVVAQVNAIRIFGAFFGDGGEVARNIGTGGTGFLTGDVAVEPVKVFGGVGGTLRDGKFCLCGVRAFVGFEEFCELSG